MRKRRRKMSQLAAVSVGVICAFAVIGAVAVGAAEDRWVAGANHAWTATSSKINFVSSTVTTTCTMNTAAGSTVGRGPDIGALTMHAPQFSGCKDSLWSADASDTVTTKAYGWKVSFVSDIGNSKCPPGAGKDESSGGDCVVITVPKKGITILVGGLGDCKLTVQPGGPTSVGAKLADPGGATKDTFTLSNQPLTYTGCGTSGILKLSGTYTLTSPHNGVLVDTS